MEKRGYALNEYRDTKEFLVLRSGLLKILTPCTFKLKDSVLVHSKFQCTLHGERKLLLRSETYGQWSYVYSFDSEKDQLGWFDAFQQEIRIEYKKQKGRIETLKEGFWAHKINFGNGKKVKRYVWLSPDCSEIRWGPTKINSKYSKHPLSDLTEVIYGPYSDSFRKLRPEVYNDWLCVSLEGSKRTIDLYVLNEVSARNLVLGLQCLLAKNGQTNEVISETQFLYRKIKHKLRAVARANLFTLSAWICKKVRLIAQDLKLKRSIAIKIPQSYRPKAELLKPVTCRKEQKKTPLTISVAPSWTSPYNKTYSGTALSSVIGTPTMKEQCTTDRSCTYSNCDTAATTSALSKKDKDILLRTFHSCENEEFSSERQKHGFDDFIRIDIDESSASKSSLSKESLDISVTNIEKNSPSRVAEDVKRTDQTFYGLGSRLASDNFVAKPLFGANQSFSLDAWATDLSKIEPETDPGKMIVLGNNTSRFRSPTKEDIAGLKNKIAELTEDNNGLFEKYQDLVEENGALKEHLKAKDDTIKRLEEEYANEARCNEVEISEYRKKCTEMEKQMKQLLSENAQLVTETKYLLLSSKINREMKRNVLDAVLGEMEYKENEQYKDSLKLVQAELSEIKRMNTELYKEAEENHISVNNVWPHFINLMVCQCRKVNRMRNKYNELVGKRSTGPKVKGGHK